MLYIAHYASPVGNILLAAKNNALVGLWLHKKHYSSAFTEETTEQEDYPILQQTKKWLDAYFAGEKPKLSSLKLAPTGSAFAKQVWKLLEKIPYGKTVTYGELAQKIAQKNGLAKMSAQAVGGAVGHNPISIIVPCHRVIGAGGNLTGYGGGMANKIKLLKHEGAWQKVFFVPKKAVSAK